MRASELIDVLAECMTESGDMEIFTGDMEKALIEVRVAEDPGRYGESYLYISQA